MIFKWLIPRLKNINRIKGVSLVELIIAVAILGIIAAPLVGTMLHSTRNNVSTREKTEADALAQKYMEEIQASTTTMTTTYDGLKDADGIAVIKASGDSPSVGYLVNYKVTNVTETLTEDASYTLSAPSSYHLSFNIPNGANYVDFGARSGQDSLGSGKTYTLELLEDAGIYKYNWINTDLDPDVTLIPLGIINGVTGNTIDIDISCNDTANDFNFNIDRRQLPYTKDVRVFVKDDSGAKVVAGNSAPSSHQLKFTVPSAGTNVSFLGKSYDMTVVGDYKLELTGSDDSCDYVFKNPTPETKASGNIKLSTVSDPLDILIDYNNSSEDFELEIVNSVLNNKKAYVYVEEAGNTDLTKITPGVNVNLAKANYYYYNITSNNSKVYSNSLYKVEVKVSKDNVELKNLLSYVKK